MDLVSIAESPRNKRHKVSIACDRCRAKKIKCDSVRPVCAPCSKRKGAPQRCTWDSGDSRSLHVSAAQLLKLQDRIRELEGPANPRDSPDVSSGQDSSSHVAHGMAKTGVADVLPRGSIAHNLDFMGEKSPSRFPTDPNQPSQRQGQDPKPSGPSPGLPFTLRDHRGPRVPQNWNTAASGMIGSFSDDAQSQSQEFFGGSSAGCFINQVRRAVKMKMRTPESGTQPRRPPAAEVDLFTTGEPLSHLSSPDVVFPARNMADQLLHVYWDIVYVLYPFVDKAETMLRYENLFSGHSEYEEAPMFVCLLNIIFALSCQLSGAIEIPRRESFAKVYYQRAKRLLDLSSTASFASVQVYLLLGQYFQSTNEPHQCWMMIGAAIRTSQSLGLHLPETTEQIMPLRRRELARTVWYGCVIMDRVVSMTYGRPPMVNAGLAAAVPRPLPVEGHCLPSPGNPVSPASHPSILDFFLQTIDLYEILYDVLVTFYSSSSGGNLTEDDTERNLPGRPGGVNVFSSIDIDQRLVRWQSRLPSHLRLRDSPHDVQLSQCFVRQAVILQQRYLHVRLLSLRPILSAYVAAETSEVATADFFGGVLSQRVAFQCAVMCATVAQEAIQLAYTRRSSDPNSVGPVAAWWYNVLFVYSAATVLIAVRLCPSLITDISKESLSDAWSRAIEFLEHYRPFNAVIEQLVATLHILYSVLPERYLQTNGTGSSLRAHDQALNPGSLDSSAHRVHADEHRDVTSQLEALPVEDGPGAGLSTMLDNHAPTHHDFEFSFDSHDLSWLTAMPFEL